MRISDWSSDVCSSDLDRRDRGSSVVVVSAHKREGCGMDVDSIADWLGSARIVDLGHPMAEGMPQSPNHPQFRMALQRRHGERQSPGGDSAAQEIIVTGGHVGTQIDEIGRAWGREREW